jgi:hypothetical protein
MSNYNIQISWSGKDALSDSDPLKVISGTDFQTEFEAVRTAINSKAETVDILASVYPVGSIYINATNSSNPSSLLGFGTWTAFGAGRVPVGFDASDSNFDTAEETGGSKDAIVVSHTHTTTVTDPGHSHTANENTSPEYVGTGVYRTDVWNDSATNTSTSTTGISVSVDSTGSSGTNANLQPYITVYMWKRTA